MKKAKRTQSASPVVYEPSDKALEDLRNSEDVWGELDLLEMQCATHVALCGIAALEELLLLATDAEPERGLRRIATP